MSGRVQACVCWPSSVTLMAAPLQDSGSLERRKPISLNSQRAAHRDTEVLHSNFTAINPHHSDGAGGSGRWQPEGKEMGSDSGRTPLYPILLDLLFSPRRGSQRLSWKHTPEKTKFICVHSISDIHTLSYVSLPTQTNPHTLTHRLAYLNWPLIMNSYHALNSAHPKDKEESPVQHVFSEGFPTLCCGPPSPLWLLLIS